MKHKKNINILLILCSFFADYNECFDIVNPCLNGGVCDSLCSEQKLEKYYNFSSENYHFYSREILQYITWACLSNYLRFVLWVIGEAMLKNTSHINIYGEISKIISSYHKIHNVSVFN